MTSKHTPGPWSCKQGERPNFFYIESSEGDVVYVSGTLQPEQCEANAQLIAAAPELLSSLSKKVNDAEQACFEEWLDSKSPRGDHEEVQREWRQSSDYKDFFVEWDEQIDAIAKATGAA